MKICTSCALFEFASLETRPQLLKAGLMSGSRKLQTEIDKALKKIGEGVDLFNEIWDKVGCHA